MAVLYQIENPIGNHRQNFHIIYMCISRQMGKTFCKHNQIPEYTKAQVDLFNTK